LRLGAAVLAAWGVTRLAIASPWPRLN
jgi:hypothetical protein